MVDLADDHAVDEEVVEQLLFRNYADLVQLLMLEAGMYRWSTACLTSPI